MKTPDKKYFIDDKKIIDTIETVLNPDENILWRGKPLKKSFILSAVLKMLPLVILWVGIDVTLIVCFAIFLEIDWWFYLIFAVFFLFHLMPLWIYIWNIITAFRRLKIEEYAFTDKRIIIKRGFLAPNIISIYYSSITSINLRIGVIEKACKVGDIYIVSENGKFIIEDISNPYYIYSELQRIANDIKSDIIYPNNLRPSENNGYKTSYTNKK